MIKTSCLLFALFASVNIAEAQTAGNDSELASVVVNAVRDPGKEINVDLSSFTDAFPGMSRVALQAARIRFISRDAAFDCRIASPKAELCRYAAESPLLTIESVERDGNRAVVQVKREQRLRISPYVLMTLYSVQAQLTPKGWQLVDSKIIGQS